MKHFVQVDITNMPEISELPVAGTAEHTDLQCKLASHLGPSWLRLCQVCTGGEGCSLEFRLDSAVTQTATRRLQISVVIVDEPDGSGTPSPSPTIDSSGLGTAFGSAFAGSVCLGTLQSACEDETGCV